MSRNFDGRPLSAYFDCGREMGTDRAMMYQVNVQMTTLIREQGSGASVRTQVQAGNPRLPMQCVSTGLFEQTIAEALTTRIR
jgi:hypothetical protein